MTHIMRIDEFHGKHPKYYVAADTESQSFDDYDEAYEYAKRCAEESREENPNDWEEIHLMDNEKWETIVLFDERGIHNLENGASQPWQYVL